MNYTEWLTKNGIRCSGIGLSEEKANELAKSSQDPGSGLMAQIRRIVVHHSATETGNASVFRVLHRAVNGWNDIAYHFVIGNGTLSDDGEVETGRPLPYKGAHARGGNEDSIGICLVGNFNLSDPTAAQTASLGKLLKSLMGEYGIDANGVILHRDVNGSETECPGRLLSIEKVIDCIDI